ncbi:peptidoglycan editing factor PgeF [Shewanella gaetbuli]|uniref:Purine nucleoside phosphorylase n=1 Tax=Shewanella gaetbuli TaxID=220752 RepID=A0A9X2CFD4_9GAMM|nr:peptidoglycan editing factor PgeF [Shewanella gaetbuli]MCL1141288.1 peptidoglycan editing factor PgeF [Shewanella gaetbuli]
MHTPDWPLPCNVGFAFTDRHGGVSNAPYNSLNLGLHVDDAPQQVLANRRILVEKLQLPNEPIWLEQVHGIDILPLDDYSIEHQAAKHSAIPIADGSYTRQVGQVCAVMTADCLPVLLCDKQGTQVAAVHAGWRGLCAGVIEQAVKQFTTSADNIIACFGPAIGPKSFEVGLEVRQAFIDQHPHAATCFTEVAQQPNKFLADMKGLAGIRLSALGISTLYNLDECTVLNPNYFSYRRDQQTGRMASLIWLKA